MKSFLSYKFIFIRSALAALLILFFNASSFSQQLEANWWYFGLYAGVHFSNGFAEADTNGALLTSRGAASYSDTNGDLLVYTDGLLLYNKNHVLTPNGNNPFGIPFAPVRLAMLVQHPSNNSILYCFVTVVLVGTHSFSYLLKFDIDLNLNNGLGDIVVNSLDTIQTGVSFGLACLDHTNGIDKWIVCHSDSGDTYYSFLIDSTGVSNTSIISNIGHFSTPSSSPPTSPVRHIKNSPDSKTIASMYAHPENKVEIFEFNQSTGELYNLVYSQSFNHEFTTGSFSANSKVLYLGLNQNLVQLDLSILDSNLISNSIHYVYTVSNFHQNYDMQLALDGKIYLCNSFSSVVRKLSIIHCPNLLGNACNHVDTIVDLKGRAPISQLPALNQTLFVNAHILQAQNKSGPICPGDSARLVAYGAGADRFIWTLQDGSAANSLSNDTLPNPLAFPDSTTTYRVVGIASSCTVDNLDTAYITVVVNPTPSSPFGNAVLVCDNDTASLSLPFASNVLWSTGDTSQSIQLSQQGSYWFIYTDSNGCQSDTLHFQVQEQDSGQIQLNAPNQVCANQTVEANALGASPVMWQNVANPIVIDSQRLVFRADTSFWLVASSASPCILPDSVFVEVIPAPHFGANTDSVLCLPDSFLFSPNTTNQSNLHFVWLGETDTLNMNDFPQKFWVDSILSKQLIAFVFSGCYDTLDVQLRVKETEVLPNSAFELKQSCEGLLLKIFPENNSLWFVNGVLQSANNLKVNAGDTLMKITQNSTDACFAKEQIRLGGEGAQNQLADLANVFTPNGDGINDVFGPKNPSDFLCAELKIYNRWGLLVFQSKVGSPPVWNGRSPSALELPEGVYFYVFSIDEESQRGSVNLMR